MDATKQLHPTPGNMTVYGTGVALASVLSMCTILPELKVHVNFDGDRFHKSVTMNGPHGCARLLFDGLHSVNSDNDAVRIGPFRVSVNFMRKDGHRYFDRRHDQALDAYIKRLKWTCNADIEQSLVSLGRLVLGEPVLEPDAIEEQLSRLALEKDHPMK